MKTINGFYTNGTYIMYESGYTGSWKVETKDRSEWFETKEEAEEYLKENRLDIIWTETK